MPPGEHAKIPAPGTGPLPGARLLVPDLARGTMLALIALANVHHWFRSDPDTPGPAEEVVTGLLSLLVDARAYPLFALLLGYGLATLARRSIDEGLAAGLAPEEAERRATTLLRRRGLWLVVFGAAHALFFAQDILGVYGIITISVAGVVTARRHRAALILAGSVGALATLFLLSVGAESALARNHGSAAQVLFEQAPLGPILNLTTWVVVAPATVPISMALPAALLGVLIAGRGPLERPHRHRRALALVVVVGLVVPTIVMPVLWVGASGDAILEGVLVAWHQGPAGLLSGAAYLALIALVASHRGAGKGPLGRTLAATGRRSLSAYLAQTVLMALLAGVLRLYGIDSLTSVWQALIAVTVWAVSVLGCFLAEHHGVPGPAERLLRRLVHMNTRV
ncbi:DUF418 domain-containing protein [Nocardiopsis alba]|uniref:DUF418 domain-containing protein n=1 Tax=Nocardiopsis alba TaxID=53437 RepID=UPI0033BD2802